MVALVIFFASSVIGQAERYSIAHLYQPNGSTLNRVGEMHDCLKRDGIELGSNETELNANQWSEIVANTARYIAMERKEWVHIIGQTDNMRVMSLTILYCKGIRIKE